MFIRSNKACAFFLYLPEKKDVTKQTSYELPSNHQLFLIIIIILGVYRFKN